MSPFLFVQWASESGNTYKEDSFWLLGLRCWESVWCFSKELWAIETSSAAGLLWRIGVACALQGLTHAQNKKDVAKAVQVCCAGAKWKVNTFATYDCNSSWRSLGSSKKTSVSSLQSDSMQNKNKKVYSRNCNRVVLDGMQNKNKKQTTTSALTKKIRVRLVCGGWKKT